MGFVAGCSHAPSPEPTAPAGPPLWLLGEVHDNAAGHQARLQVLEARIEAGWRPAIAMEQFDRGQQVALNAAVARCRDAACVVDRVVTGKSGWNWDHYKPVIALALAHGLPIVAANLSRDDASMLVKGGFGKSLPPALIARYQLDTLPASVLQAQVAEVRDGHCGMLPEAMLEPMAKAQIARDVVMAEAIRPHSDQGVVLIAGNGHVRDDIGVPYWLRQLGLESRAEGFIEPVTGSATETPPYDAVHIIPAQERPDPCAEFRQPSQPKANGHGDG